VVLGIELRASHLMGESWYFLKSRYLFFTVVNAQKPKIKVLAVQCQVKAAHCFLVATFSRGDDR
jgi:hypothetical protein